jgi:tetratricopeptide (TPR) repeat protein
MHPLPFKLMLIGNRNLKLGEKHPAREYEYPDGILWASAGLLEEVRGDAEGALQLFKRASEARPLNVDSILASSRLSLDMGRDLDETEAILKRVLEIEPGSASGVRHYVRSVDDALHIARDVTHSQDTVHLPLQWQLRAKR